MKINSLTHAEEGLMQVMWDLESAYLKDILAHYPEPKPHQNTVSTFLKILVEKKFLTAQREGRIFRYVVAVPFEAYRLFLLKILIGDYYANSAKELVKDLVQEKMLENAEVAAILNLSEEKTAAVEPVQNPISDFIEEITAPKKKKKDKKKKKKKNK